MIEKKIYLEGVDPVKLFGINNSRFERIKQNFPKLKIVARGSELIIKGENKEIARLEETLNHYIDYLQGTEKPDEEQLEELLMGNGREILANQTVSGNILLYGESGKPISECQMTDLPETVSTLKWHAEAADKIYDQISPTNESGIGLIVREPVGVVGAVLPWNFPLMMLAWKIGPALATGNSVIVKPAEQTSLTTLRVAELAIEAGIPAGVLNVLPGLGPDVAEPMGRHHGIGVISSSPIL